MYVHDLDPFLIEFGSSGQGIRWYGLAYLAGFTLGYLFTAYLAKKDRIDINLEKVGDFVTWAAIGVMAGGRIGYCLFYAPETLIEFTSDFPFWGVLAVHKGGMASHGGIMGLFVVCWWFGRKNGVSWLQLLDISSMIGGLAIFFGRLANFVNGELFGREAPAGYAWAVKFPSEVHYWAGYQVQKLAELKPVVAVMETIPELKSRLHESVNSELWNKLVFSYEYKSEAQYHVNQVLNTMIWATQNGFYKVNEALAPILTSRYPSQLHQAFMEGFGVFLICFIVWAKPQKPGLITSIFGSVYSIMRVAGEQFRMPDAHIGFQLFGLTRGQWLSFGLLVFAIGFGIYVLRQNNEKAGGWWKA